MKRMLTAALLLVAATAGEARDVGAGGSLDPALADPPATGLLVVRVLPGTPAERNGVREGDVIVAYGSEETPDLPALNYAKGLVEAGATVKVRIVRFDEERTVSLDAGRMGVQILPVKKGVRVEPLPAPSGVVLDLSGVSEEPREDWYALYRDGEKSGLGRIEVSRVGRMVYIATEEVFHGEGEEPELRDHEVTVALTATKEPRPVLTVFHDRLNDLTRIAAADEDDHGGTTLTMMTTGAGSDGRRGVFPLPRRPIPSYALETIATFLPREEGACLRFQPLVEARGDTAMPGALRCAGRREYGDATAWRFDWHELGSGIVATFWVRDEGRMVGADYGYVRARRTTEEDARTGQPKDIADRIPK